MRLQRAKFFSFLLPILVVIFSALMFGQCIFFTQADTTKKYTELIPDYHEFIAPTKLSAYGGNLVVFDSGKAVVFTESGTESFSVGADYCYSLCMSDNDIAMLVGNTEERSAGASVKVFSYAGATRDVTVAESNVLDIAISDGKLLVLFEETIVVSYYGQTIELSFTSIAYYDLVNPQNKIENLPLSTSDYQSSYIVADNDTFYLRTDRDNMIVRTESGFDVVARNPANLSRASKNFAVLNGQFYYYKSNGVFKGDASASFIQMGDADHLVTGVTDIALDGEFIYVLDGDYRAVKVFHVETGEFRRYIGSCGKNLGRLNDPIALSVKDQKIAVVDASMRASVFSHGRVNALSGHQIASPTDIELAGEYVYLADAGILFAYRSDFRLETDYSFPTRILYVAAGADGSAYAAGDNVVYVKKANDDTFFELFRAEADVERLNVGIGGKVVYVLAGGKLHAYTAGGEPLMGHLELTRSVVDFSVDYRGNLFLLTSSGEIVRYLRTVNGYYSPTEFYIGNDFKQYADISIDKDGTLYLTADHNIISFAKNEFGVVTEEDSDFNDNVAADASLFVGVVQSPSTIAYVAPDNFEDVSYIAQGKKLMCYARLTYQGNDYLRVETEKGVAYVPAEDMHVYERDVAAPFARARCLHTKIGVNLYACPSWIDIERGVAPLFSALPKEEVFDVLSYVALTDEGEDAWGFYRVRYQDVYAYALASDVVSVDEELVPIERYKVTIKSEKLGKMVILYEDASVDSVEVARLSDGTEIYALEPLDSEKEFIQVLYQGKVCYVQSQYLGDGGLSAGQTLAIVLSVVTVTASIIMYLIFRAGKRRKVVYKE